MLGDISGVEHIYLACGYTDLRLGIDSLAQLVQQFSLDPFSNSLFRAAFCEGKFSTKNQAVFAAESPEFLNQFLHSDSSPCGLFCCIMENRNNREGSSRAEN